MRLHRFYCGPDTKLTGNLWIKDRRLLHQWVKVFRLSAGAEVILFDGTGPDRMYQILKIDKSAAQLNHVTDLGVKAPKNDVYLLWSLLKKDKNDWVLQKATELGVNYFWPIITERSERKSFDMPRSKKIITEAAEQCGRTNIPALREPALLLSAITSFEGKGTLVVCDQNGPSRKNKIQDAVGILVGPEGGWSNDEMTLLKKLDISPVNISDFTLRAETASIVACSNFL